MAEHQLEAKDLPDICNELCKVTTTTEKLFKIGVQLKIHIHKLEEFISGDNTLAKIIDYWLNGNVVDGPSITWESIVTVLRSEHVDEVGLAGEIEKKYCRDCTEDSSNIEKQETTSESLQIRGDDLSNTQDTEVKSKLTSSHGMPVDRGNDLISSSNIPKLDAVATDKDTGISVNYSRPDEGGDEILAMENAGVEDYLRSNEKISGSGTGIVYPSPLEERNALPHQNQPFMNRTDDESATVDHHTTSNNPIQENDSERSSELLLLAQKKNSLDQHFISGEEHKTKLTKEELMEKEHEIKLKEKEREKELLQKEHEIKIMKEQQEKELLEKRIMKEQQEKELLERKNETKVVEKTLMETEHGKEIMQKDYEIELMQKDNEIKHMKEEKEKESEDHKENETPGKNTELEDELELLM